MEEAEKLQEWQNQQMSLQQPSEPQVQTTPYEPLPRYSAPSPQYYTPRPQQLPWQFPQPQVQQPYVQQPQVQQPPVQQLYVQQPQVPRQTLEPIPNGYVEEYTDTQEYQPQTQVDSDEERMYQPGFENQNWIIDPPPAEPTTTTSPKEAVTQEPLMNIRLGPADLTQAEQQDAFTLWNTSDGLSYLQAINIIRAARHPRQSAELQKQAEAAKHPKSRKDAKTVT